MGLTPKRGKNRRRADQTLQGAGGLPERAGRRPLQAGALPVLKTLLRLERGEGRGEVSNQKPFAASEREDESNRRL